MLSQALALLEVRGLGAAIEVADAMAKSAAVRLLPPVQTDPGLITLLACGDHGACAAALDAGRLHAQRLQALVSERLIGRPEPDLQHFCGAPVAPAASPVPAKPAPAPRSQPGAGANPAGASAAQTTRPPGSEPAAGTPHATVAPPSTDTAPTTPRRPRKKRT